MSVVVIDSSTILTVAGTGPLPASRCLTAKRAETTIIPLKKATEPSQTIHGIQGRAEKLGSAKATKTEEPRGRGTAGAEDH